MHLGRAVRMAAALAVALATVLGDRAGALAQEPDAATPTPATPTADLGDLDLADLMKVEVTTPLRRPKELLRTPAAVFVIDDDDIRRSGERDIPDLLRMAPGTAVARESTSRVAVTVRGQNGRFGSELLVLFDGRRAYNPFFGGIFWEVEDAFLADVERIEVVRGPGSVAWGVNAVNGVVNVISKPARATQGLLVEGGGGTEERAFGGVRYGGAISDGAHWRVYAKAFKRDDGHEGDDAFSHAQGGFRLDLEPGDADTITFAGDIYDAALDEAGIAFSPSDPAGVAYTDVGSSRVDLQACKLEYSIVSPK